MSPETAGGVDTEAVPVLKTGRCDHFTFPLSMSTANRPPRFVGLPASIIVPATVAGPQSLKPGLTVSFSAGAVRSGWIAGGSCANPNTVHHAAPIIAPPPRHRRFDNLIDAFFLHSLSHGRDRPARLHL